MSQYYYTVSSLPYLSLESKPDYSVDDFIDHCSAELAREKLAILSKVSLVPIKPDKNSPHILHTWHAFASSFRNYLVQVRAKNFNRDFKSYLRPSEETFEAIVKAKQAIVVDNPLEAELAIIKAHYNFLEELQVGHFFDFDFLIIYKLKLELLVRKFSFTQEMGMKNFDQIDEHFSSIISSGGIHE